MLKTIASSFHGFSFEQSVKHKEPNCSKGFVYRDELSKKVQPSTMEKGKPKKGDCRSKHKTTGVVEEKGTTVMRVKVKMTKQEAARLLAKCKEGGTLEFKDVARELVEIPVGRVSIVDHNLMTAGAGKTSALESIPE
ncbi:hypothetical protein SLEP1_g47718 [Rubroshorea leprosula]|uniref:DUF7890 domain-containing protein n=1 Tax=Rubroshorea leprosula TaxID=152421 RepID=A0AAV5LS95_9ROSI|nr:hypothetical protein SLEP1_g47718 [Rubroshorea leprosula]